MKRMFIGTCILGSIVVLFIYINCFNQSRVVNSLDRKSTADNIDKKSIALAGDLANQISKPNNPSDEELQVTMILRKVSDICQARPPEQVMPGMHSDKSAYIKEIAPLIENRDLSMFALKNISSSGKVSKFESRLAMILYRRLESPALFDAVEPYYIPDDEDPLGNLAPSTILSTTHNKTVELKPLKIEMMHESVRDIATKNEKAFQEVQAAASEMLAEAKQHQHGGIEVYDKIKKRFASRLMEIRAKHDLDYESLRMLKKATGLRDGPPIPMDKKYLEAWEEAMIRPVPWIMRRHFSKIVLDLSDDASLPSLGMLLRQATSQASPLAKDSASSETIITDILDSIINRNPNYAILIELSDTIRLTSGEGKERLQYKIWGRISRRKIWQEYLAEQSSDPSKKIQVGYILDSKKIYERKESLLRAYNLPMQKPSAEQKPDISP